MVVVPWPAISAVPVAESVKVITPGALEVQVAVRVEPFTEAV